MVRAFRQIDVFGDGPYAGNPVVVILDAEGLEDEQLRAFSVWTNLSECTFVLPPTEPTADYRVRIFNLSTEIPFAGHPTLGSARAWLDAGGVPRSAGTVVQQCGAGLIPIRIAGDELSFAAPPQFDTYIRVILPKQRMLQRVIHSPMLWNVRQQIAANIALVLRASNSPPTARSPSRSCANASST